MAHTLLKSNVGRVLGNALDQTGCRALMEHYGIGELTSVAMLAELGNTRRFSSSKKAVRFAAEAQARRTRHLLQFALDQPGSRLRQFATRPVMTEPAPHLAQRPLQSLRGCRRGSGW